MLLKKIKVDWERESEKEEEEEEAAYLLVNQPYLHSSLSLFQFHSPIHLPTASYLFINLPPSLINFEACQPAWIYELYGVVW